MSPRRKTGAKIGLAKAALTPIQVRSLKSRAESLEVAIQKIGRPGNYSLMSETARTLKEKSLAKMRSELAQIRVRLSE
ncbi:MAG: hypothetical protein WC821_01065 [archaeon]|jgi:RNA-binding protein YhbY